MSERMNPPAQAAENDVDWEGYFRARHGGDLMAYLRRKWRYNQPVFESIQRRHPSGARILEFGSGSGTYSAMLSMFGYDVTGVDLDPKMVAMAQRLATDVGAKSARFLQGSVLDLDAHMGAYDLAYSSGVIEHFHHPEAVEVVRQAGRCAPEVFVLVPSYWSWRRAKDEAEGIFEPYTMFRLRRVVREAGLEIREEVAFSAGNKLGRAVELLAPPMVAPYLFKHLASTIGIVAHSPSFKPAPGTARP